MSPNQPASLGAAAAKPISEPVQLNWQRMNVIGGLLVIIGILGFIAGLATGNTQRVWLTWLVCWLFFMSIAQGGVIVSVAFYLVQGRWAGSLQYKLAQSFWLFLPLGVILFAGVAIGRDYIFPWIAHPAKDKEGWLNAPFLISRDWIAIIILTFMSWLMVRWSRQPQAIAWQRDSHTIEMPPRGLRRLSPAVGIVYCIVFSLLAFDLIMSLSPQWRSTLFGWWFFETAFWVSIAAMALGLVLMARILPPGNSFTVPELRHDCGKMVFAFSIFWIYLSFAQYIVIWYGDIPVETFFILVRFWHHPWMFMSWLSVFFIWVIPFFFLMGVRPKKSLLILGGVAVLGLIGVWDLYYIMIVPSLSPNYLPFGWVELCILAGFLGAFLLTSVPGLKLVAEEAIVLGPSVYQTHGFIGEDV
ncbi:MAG TPA: hypothetical protein VMF50_11030 [Candidatus Binataceae bacterium]|nr:hypothetical protein [Candidatus Binataceae bacterium]